MNFHFLSLIYLYPFSVSCLRAKLLYHSLLHFILRMVYKNKPQATRLHSTGKATEPSTPSLFDQKPSVLPAM